MKDWLINKLGGYTKKQLRQRLMLTHIQDVLKLEMVKQVTHEEISEFRPGSLAYKDMLIDTMVHELADKMLREGFFEVITRDVPVGGEIKVRLKLLKP